jgi:NADH-quinone oxidoreductase subunit E
MDPTPMATETHSSGELSSATKTKILALVSRYADKAAALLPALHLAQDEVGALPPAVQAQVAELLGVPTTQVREVVSFYEMYHEGPEGKFHLEICTNIACHLLGADKLVTHCKKRLGVEVGHHTADNTFSLMEAECLASCGSGPMMRVGNDYYEAVDEAGLDALIDRFQKLAPSVKGHYAQGPEGAHVGPIRGHEPKKPS